MWAIKILNGPQAGKIFQLELGTHSIGRSHHATIRVESSSVSKIHAQFLVTEDKVIISDQQSSNGVFVNGVKVQNQVLRSGDKFLLSEVLFDVIYLPKNVSLIPKTQQRSNSSPAHRGQGQTPPTQSMVNYTYDGNQALSTATGSQTDITLPEEKPQLGIQDQVERYIDEVALPGVYKFSNRFDLKYVLASFVVIFVLIVTVLSVFPIISISRDFIVDESRRRAESLTRLLVQTNREYLVSNNEINVSVSIVQNEPGVDKAFIIAANDGHIIAPISKRGKYSKNPFLQSARKRSNKYFKIMDKSIGVSMPILNHNPATGEPTAVAYAVILYNMDKVALDIPRALGLIIHILVITIIAGAILYFFLYRVITKPLHDLDVKMDIALKEGNSEIELDSPTPIFQKLVSNINSALSRMGSSFEENPSVSLGDKVMEASELVYMFPVAAIALSAETEMFIAKNDYLSGHLLFDDDDIIDKYLDDLTDPSLIQSMKDLLTKSQGNPNQRHTNVIPTQGGERFEMTVKAIQEMSDVSYYIISFTEIYDEEEYDE